jgi:phosphoribosyl-ATP pyrophosphohydrolase/phosphoribosyl-AMP cyclohydrolase
MNLNYKKCADGLIPAIVQDADTRAVLMMAFMNEEALNQTQETGRVTFYSRSRQQLWTKGETSGNYLEVISIGADCDEDTLLIAARPAGPVCHTGAATCFGETNAKREPTDFLIQLENVIDDRKSEKNDTSYVAGLFEKGINKIAQKVGEEAIELVIEAKDDDWAKFRSEAADLLFHFLILMRAKDVSIGDVLEELKRRRK